MEKVNILGINLAKLSKLDCLKTIESFLAGSTPRLIVTPNAEFILRAQHDEEFFHILNQADLAVLDGSGPQFASWATGNFIRRYPGADLVIDLIKLAEQKKQKVLILNWEGGLSSKGELAAIIGAKFPGLEADILDIDRAGLKFNLAAINNFAPNIIISTLGAPYQEKLLYHNLKTIPSLRASIGVGGALDFLSGKVRRAPAIMRLLGIEWLWRVLQKPAASDRKIIYKRYSRIWNATFVFVYKFLRWHLISPFLYRPNVACFLYKKVGNEYLVLLVKRIDLSDHWQLPQGGTDGESIEIAGKRELEEEVGITCVKTIKTFKNISRYSFKKQKRSEIIRYSGYKGQKQSLFIGEYLGNDQEIKINFWDHAGWQWVPISKFIETAHEVRRPGYQKFFKLFLDTIKNEI